MSERPTSEFVVTYIPGLLCEDWVFFPCAAISIGGRVFVICNEGVGREVTEAKPFNAHLNGDYNEVHMLTPTKIRGMIGVNAAVQENQFTLDKWIREFGARLEGNWWSWERQLLDATNGE